LLKRSNSNPPFPHSYIYIYILNKDYTDYAQTSPPINTLPLKARGGAKVTFPIKLHRMLDYAHNTGKTDIIRWLPHGRAFFVIEKDRFVKETIPLFFKFLTEYASFQRQLNIYGFLRLTKNGSDQHAYYHEIFLRGRPELCHYLAPRPRDGNGLNVRMSIDPATEPDLHSYPYIASGEPSPIIAIASLQKRAAVVDTVTVSSSYSAGTVMASAGVFLNGDVIPITQPRGDQGHAVTALLPSSASTVTAGVPYSQHVAGVVVVEDGSTGLNASNAAGIAAFCNANLIAMIQAHHQREGDLRTDCEALSSIHSQRDSLVRYHEDSLVRYQEPATAATQLKTSRLEDVEMIPTNFSACHLCHSPNTNGLNTGCEKPGLASCFCKEEEEDLMFKLFAEEDRLAGHQQLPPLDVLAGLHELHPSHSSVEAIDVYQPKPPPSYRLFTCLTASSMPPTNYDESPHAWLPRQADSSTISSRMSKLRAVPDGGSSQITFDDLSEVSTFSAVDCHDLLLHLDTEVNQLSRPKKGPMGSL
jgi:hypothetical protein